jgi:23S rRNA pseudouridine2457 synthase
MENHRHFMLNKPYGFISQFVTNQKVKKKLLGELYDFPLGTMAIGRLDENSEGLLLLTTDGKMSEQITSSKVDKEYFVQVDGLIDNEAVMKLQTGVSIGFEGVKYLTKPCKVSVLANLSAFESRAKKIRDDRHGPTSWISVTINEGKFRQVRKMTAAVGFPTLRLVRVRVGAVLLNDLKSGQVIEIDDFKNIFC